MSGTRQRLILFIVEGEDVEVRLIEAAFHALGLRDEHHIVPYRTNIHDLLDRLDRDYDGAYADIDIRLVLAAAHPEDRGLLLREYSDILLVFDYEPQDNRFNPERLADFARTFCESSGPGKLYLNYPMVESYKHFERFGDTDYLDSMVSVSEIQGYKKMVGDDVTAIHAPEDLAHGLVLPWVIAMNCSKVDHLAKGMPASDTCMETGSPLATNCQELDLLGFMDIQNATKAQRGDVYVCNTSLFFVADWAAALNGMWRAAWRKGLPSGR